MDIQVAGPVDFLTSMMPLFTRHFCSYLCFHYFMISCAELISKRNINYTNHIYLLFMMQNVSQCITIIQSFYNSLHMLSVVCFCYVFSQVSMFYTYLEWSCQRYSMQINGGFSSLYVAAGCLGIGRACFGVTIEGLHACEDPGCCTSVCGPTAIASPSIWAVSCRRK